VVLKTLTINHYWRLQSFENELSHKSAGIILPECCAIYAQRITLILALRIPYGFGYGSPDAA